MGLSGKNLDFVGLILSEMDQRFFSPQFPFLCFYEFYQEPLRRKSDWVGSNNPFLPKRELEFLDGTHFKNRLRGSETFQTSFKISIPSPKRQLPFRNVFQSATVCLTACVVSLTSRQTVTEMLSMILAQIG